MSAIFDKLLNVTFWQNIKLFLSTPTLPLKSCNILLSEIHYCSCAKWQKHIWHVGIQEKKRYMYFFPEVWDIMKTYNWCILDDAMQHKVDELFHIIRKIKPIICLLLQVQGFVYQTIISQHYPSLQMKMEYSPFCFMSRTVVQPSLILYTGWRRAHQDNRWWMASKWGWRRQPMNQQCSGHHDATQTYFTLGL